MGTTGKNGDGTNLEAGTDSGPSGKSRTNNTQVLVMALCLTLLVSAAVVVTRQRARSTATNQQRDSPVKISSAHPAAPATPLPILTPAPDDFSRGTTPNELYAWETEFGGQQAGNKDTTGSARRKSRLSVVMNPSVYVPRTPSPGEEDFSEAAVAEVNGSVYFVPRSPEDVGDTAPNDEATSGATIMERSPVTGDDATTGSQTNAGSGQFYTARSPVEPAIPTRTECVYNLIPKDSPSATPKQADEHNHFMMRSPQVPKYDAEPSEPNQLYASRSPSPTTGRVDNAGAEQGAFFTMRSPMVSANPEPTEDRQDHTAFVMMRSPATAVGEETSDEYVSSPIEAWAERSAYVMMRSPAVTASTSAGGKESLNTEPSDSPVSGDAYVMMRSPVVTGDNTPPSQAPASKSRVQGQAVTSRSPAAPTPQIKRAVEGGKVVVRSPLVPRQVDSPIQQQGQAMTARSPAQRVEKSTQFMSPRVEMGARSPLVSASQGAFVPRSPAEQRSSLQHQESAAGTQSPVESAQPSHGGGSYVTMRSPAPASAPEQVAEAVSETGSPYEQQSVPVQMSPAERAAAEGESVSPDKVLNPFMPTTIEAVEPRKTWSQDPVSAVRTTTQIAATYMNRASPDSWARSNSPVDEDADESLPIEPAAMEAAEELMTFMMSSLPKSPALYGTVSRDAVAHPSPPYTAPTMTIATQTPESVSDWNSPAGTDRSMRDSEHSFMLQPWSPIVNEPNTPELSMQGTPSSAKGKEEASATKKTAWAPFFRPQVSVYPPMDTSTASPQVERADEDVESDSPGNGQVRQSTAFFVPLDASPTRAEWGPKFFGARGESPNSEPVRKSENLYIPLPEDDEDRRDIIEPVDDGSFDIYSVDPPLEEGEGQFPETPLQIVGQRAPGLPQFVAAPRETPGRGIAASASTPEADEDGFQRPMMTAKKPARQTEVPMTAPRRGTAERLLQFWSPWARGAPEEAMEHYDPIARTPAQPRHRYQQSAGLAFPTISENPASNSRPTHFRAQDELLSTFQGLPASPKARAHIEELDETDL